MKKIKIIIALIGVLSILASCESNTYSEIAPLVAVPTYTKDIKNIVEVNCLGCHGAAGQFPVMETYSQLKTACETGDVLCRIQGSCGPIMPQTGAMPQNTVSTIKNWATTGYTN